MADPTTPTTPVATAASTTAIQDQTAALEDLGTGYTQATANALDFNNLQQGQISVFNQLSDRMSAYTDQLGALQSMTDTSSASFGLLSAALVKTTDSFRQFTGNIQNDRVVSFSEQYSKLLKTIKESPVGSTAAAVAADALGMSLTRQGVAAGKVTAIVGDLKKGVISTAESFLKGADNTLYYQNALIQTAAAQGDMQNLLSKTGAGFEHLNDVTRAQIETMENSMAATGLTKDHMEAYMNTLKNLPGGMSNFGQSMTVAGQQTTLLTAAIQYATGSGRDMAQVSEDMMKGMTDYGMGAENALKYTARMSEVSETLGARVEDVRTAIASSTQAFKSFVWGGVDVDAMTRGMADSMEKYVTRLQAVGVPTKNAIEMAQNLQGAMANLSVGQEAFLSQQTGGPGGVRGALQMEDLMAKDPDAAMKKMEDTIKKMSGGKIITRAEAEKSDAAANQYMKQLMILQQGPLGALVKDKQQAAALMESMASGKAGQALAGLQKKGGLGETVGRGQAIEQLSMTKVGQMNVQTDSVQLSGGVTNLGTMQDASTARSGNGAGGTTGTGRGVNIAEQDRLRAQQARGVGGTAMEQGALKELMNSAMELPQSFKDIASNFGEAMTSGDKDKEKEDLSELTERIAALKASGGDPAQLAAAQKLATQMQTDMGAGQPSEKLTPTTHPTIPGLGGTGFGGGTGKPPAIPGLGGGVHNPPGKQVGSAIPGLSGSQTGTGAGTKVGGTTPTTNTGTIPGLGGSGGPIPVTLAPGTSLTVNFTGTCPHCGTHVNTSEQARARSTASQT